MTAPDRAFRTREIAGQLRDIIEHGPDPAERAAREAARTDPWRWYCRICGATGEKPDPVARDLEANEHLLTTRCGNGDVFAGEDSGRLLHVWSYPLAALAYRD